MALCFHSFGQRGNREENCLLQKYEQCAVFDTTASQVKIKILNFKKYLKNHKKVKLGFEGHKKYYTMNAQGACISWVKGHLAYIFLENELMCTIPLKGLSDTKRGIVWCIELWL